MPLLPEANATLESMMPGWPAWLYSMSQGQLDTRPCPFPSPAASLAAYEAMAKEQKKWDDFKEWLEWGQI